MSNENKTTEITKTEEIPENELSNVHTMDRKQLSDLELKNLEEEIKSIKDTEYFLNSVKDAGFTKAVVIGITSKGIVPLSNITSMSDINMLLDMTKSEILKGANT